MPEPVDDLQSLRRYAKLVAPRRRREMAVAFAWGAGVLSDMTERYGDERLDDGEKPLHDLLSAMALAITPGDVADVVEQERLAKLEAASVRDDVGHIALCANELDGTFTYLTNIPTSCVALPGSFVRRLSAQVEAVAELCHTASHPECGWAYDPWVVLGRIPRHIWGPATQR
jgi:hypothetical protein